MLFSSIGVGAVFPNSTLFYAQAMLCDSRISACAEPHLNAKSRRDSAKSRRVMMRGPVRAGAIYKCRRRPMLMLVLKRIMGQAGLVVAGAAAVLGLLIVLVVAGTTKVDELVGGGGVVVVVGLVVARAALVTLGLLVVLVVAGAAEVAGGGGEHESVAGHCDYFVEEIRFQVFACIICLAVVVVAVLVVIVVVVVEVVVMWVVVVKVVVCGVDDWWCC